MPADDGPRPGGAERRSVGRDDLDEDDLDPDSYDPRILDRSVISIPLLRRIRHALETGRDKPIPVVIDVNVYYPGGRATATERALELIEAAVQQAGDPAVHQGAEPESRGGPYIVARLQPAVIRAMATLDRTSAAARGTAV
jgi:hypothetical protein